MKINFLVLKKVSVFLIFFITSTVVLFSCNDSRTTPDPIPIKGTLNYADLNLNYGESGTSDPIWTGALPDQTVTYDIATSSGESTEEMGISIDSKSGVVTVIDTASTMDTTSFIITATGTGDYSGAITTTISITINAIQKTTIEGTLNYADLNLNYGESGSSDPVWTGTLPDQTVTYSMTSSSGGNLPEGISINPNTGTVTVANTAELMSTTNFTVTATGTGDYSGAITTTISITINAIQKTAIKGTLNYAALNLNYGDGGTQSPTWTSPGQTATYSIRNPGGEDLPEGISIDPNTGVVTVTPLTEVMNNNIYIITATGSGNYSGTKTATIFITINRRDIAGLLSYRPLRVVYEIGGARLPTWQPETLPEVTATFTIQPADGATTVNGVSVHEETGKVIATNTTNTLPMPPTDFIVTATGNGYYTGTAEATISVTIEFITNTDNVANSDLFKLNEPTSITTLEKGGNTYVYVGSREDDAINVFRLNSDGTLISVSTTSDDNNVALNYLSSLDNAVVGNTNYVFASGRLDNGVSMFSVNNDGTLTHIQSVYSNSTDPLNEPLAVKTVVLGDTTYLYVSILGYYAMSVFTVSDSGSLTHVQDIYQKFIEIAGGEASYSITRGIVDMETVELQGNTYLYVTSESTDGEFLSKSTLTVYQVGNNGELTYVQHIQGTTYSLSAITSLSISEISGTTYLFAAGESGGSDRQGAVAAFKIINNGQLSYQDRISEGSDIFIENAYKRHHFENPRSLRSVVIESFAYIFVAGRGTDSGLGILKLDKVSTVYDFYHITSIADDFTKELQGAYAVETAIIGDFLYIIVVGSEDDGVSVFKIGI